MRKLAFLLLILGASAAHAQGAAAAQSLIPEDQLWRVHSGDDAAWSLPSFNDADWPATTLAADASTTKPGWRWYRLRVLLPAAHPPLALLLSAPENAYELYVDGARIPDAEIRSSLHLYANKDQAFPLPAAGGPLEIAIRLHYPVCYTEIYGLRLGSVAVGPLALMESQGRIAEDRRLLHLLPSDAINVAIILAAGAVLGLYLLRRSAPEYLWLGLYLAAAGWINLILVTANLGFAPLWINNYLGDACTYPLFIVEVEFVFAFTRRPMPRTWRVYQGILAAFIGCSLLTTAGLIPAGTYSLMESLSAVPALLLLPLLLLFWFFRGDRDAGWLILPTLLPAFSQIVPDAAIALQSSDLHGLEFLNRPFALGSVFFYPVDLTDLAFLLSVGAVMLLRFNRISRDQASAEADLESARTIQQILIPEALPTISGFRIESVYHPAQKVGGDFFQILPLDGGGVLAIIGDVSGKGLPAAMNVALIVGTLRTLAEGTTDPAEILAGLNRRLLGRSQGFTTALAVRILPNGQSTVASAGHLNPYLNGHELPVVSGLPLGLTSDAVYENTFIPLAPNDTFTLLTDGVLEARNPKTQELFGFDRTLAISAQSAPVIAKTAQDFGQDDDIAVLTIAYN